MSTERRGSTGTIEVDGVLHYIFRDDGTKEYPGRFNVRTAEDEAVGYVGRSSDRKRGIRVWDAIALDGTVVSRFWRRRHEAVVALVKAPR